MSGRSRRGASVAQGWTTQTMIDFVLLPLGSCGNWSTRTRPLRGPSISLYPLFPFVYRFQVARTTYVCVYLYE